jgi:hypothetical protein
VPAQPGPPPGNSPLGGGAIADVSAPGRSALGRLLLVAPRFLAEQAGGCPLVGAKQVTGAG